MGHLLSSGNEQQAPAEAPHHSHHHKHFRQPADIMTDPATGAQYVNGTKRYAQVYGNDQAIRVGGVDNRIVALAPQGQQDIKFDGISFDGTGNVMTIALQNLQLYPQAQPVMFNMQAVNLV